MNISGPKIRLARKQKSWDQTRLAFVLEESYNVLLSQSDISEIERGKRGVKDYELLAFAMALEVQVGWLLNLTNDD
jgi:transcriptional regulator with XRE-family HTH domain